MLIVKQCKAIGLREPEFIQEENFRIVLWRKEKENKPINEPINTNQTSDNEEEKIYRLIGEPINEPIKKEMLQITKQIVNQPGISRSELLEKTEKSLATVKRYLKELVDKNVIEYKGAKKTGGYHLTDEAKGKLK